MNRIAHLELRRTTAMDQALTAACSVKRGVLEEQARAFGKIIAVLRREGRKGAIGQRP